MSWTIPISAATSAVTLQFTFFDLECDHDWVQVRQNFTRVIWSGGCRRPAFSVIANGSLPVWATGPYLIQRADYCSLWQLQVLLHSDATVSGAGFVLEWIAHATDAPHQANLTCPTTGSATAACLGHGTCASNGRCQCGTGYVGEDCSTPVVCPGIDGCDKLEEIVLVSPTGNDTSSGFLHDTIGTQAVAKPLRSLVRALSVVPRNGVIVLLPGTYGGICGAVIGNANAPRLIQGLGQVDIDCQRTDRFMIIASAVLKIANVSVRNGNSASAGGSFIIRNSTIALASVQITDSWTGANGGAMHISEGSAVTLHDVRISNCSCAARGGGVFVDALSYVHAHMLELLSNTAHDGGGAYLATGAHWTGGKLTNCTATHNGGGAFMETATSLNAVAVLSNTAGKSGGGVFVSGNASLHNVSVSANSAQRGGGIAVQEGHAVLSNFNATANAAEYGGCMHVEMVHVQGTVASCRLDRAVYGGGIAVVTNSTVSGVVLADHVATAAGGGIAVFGHGTVATLEGITIERCSAIRGGGVFGDAGTWVALNGTSVIADSKGVLGGCAHLGAAAQLTGADHVGLRTCSATAGGCLFCDSCTAVRSLRAFECLAENGGGLYLNSTTTFQLRRVFLSYSVATASGGSMFLNGGEHGVRVVTEFVYLHGGIAAASGGGIYANNAAVSSENDSLDASCYSPALDLETNPSFMSPLPPCGNFPLYMLQMCAQAGSGIAAQHTTVNLTNIWMVPSIYNFVGSDADAPTSFADAWRYFDTNSMQGGGMWFQAAIVTLHNVVVLNGYAAEGGGMWLRESTLHATGFTQLTSCTASTGGGLYIHDVNAQAPSFVHGLMMYLNGAPDGGNAYVSGFNVDTEMMNDPKTEESYDPYGKLHIWFLHPRTHLSHVTSVFGIAFSGTGGGLFCHGPFRLSDSRVIGGETASDGGGLWADGRVTGLWETTMQRAVIERTLFTSNVVSAQGAAIFIRMPATISGCTFQRNRCQYGAGIFVDGTPFRKPIESYNVIIESCTFLANSAAMGAAVYFRNAGDPRDEHAKILASTFVDNVAAQGACVASIDSYVTVNNSRLQSDLALPVTGTSNMPNGVHVARNTMQSIYPELDFVMQHSQCYGLHGESGAALSIDGATAQLTNITIAQCSSTEKGGAAYLTDSTVSVHSSTFTHNNAEETGGCLHADKSRLTVEESMFAQCGAMKGGGALAAGRRSAVVLRNSSIHSSYADVGGAIFAETASSVELRNSQVQGCKADSQAGGMFLTDSVQATVVGGEITQCTAKHGGGVYVAKRAAAYFGGASVSGNTAAVGGGIYVADYASLNLNGTKIIGNRATEIAGGICVDGSSALPATTQPALARLIGCSLRANAASMGGAIGTRESSYSALHVEQSTFDGNLATIAGGAISLQGDKLNVSVRSSELHRNAVAGQAGRGGGIAIQGTADAEMNFQHLRFGINAAQTAADIYWLQRRNYYLHCTNCSWASGDVDRVATAVEDIQFVAVPTAALFSGIQLSAQQQRLVLHTIDVYGHRARQDMHSACQVVSVVPDTAQVIGGLARAADGSELQLNEGLGGVLDLSHMLVRGSVNESFVIVLACTLPDESVQRLSLNVSIRACAAGWELSGGTCRECRAGTYSIDGVVCLDCPDGASCVQVVNATDASQPGAVGVDWPLSAGGYWLHERQSRYDAACQSLLAAVGGCRAGEQLVEHRCVASKASASLWYMCMTDYQFYSCPSTDACLAGMSRPNSMTRQQECEEGNEGPLCSICSAGYSKGQLGTCVPCSGGTPTVEMRTQRGLLLAGVGLLLLFAAAAYLLGLREAVFCCRPACCRTKAVAVSELQSPAAASDMSLRQQLVARARRFARKVADFRSHIPAEKVKMLVAFAQVLAGFKDCFTAVQWPAQTFSFFQTLSFVNLDVFNIGSISCLVTTDYFANFMFMFLLPPALTLLLFVFYLGYRTRMRGELRDYGTSECPLAWQLTDDSTQADQASPSVPMSSVAFSMLSKAAGARNRPDRLHTEGAAERKDHGHHGAVSPHTELESVRHASMLDADEAAKQARQQVTLPIWDEFCREPTFNRTVNAELCTCLASEMQFAEAPSSKMLCERGKLQWRLLSVRNKCLQNFFFMLLLVYTPLSTYTLMIWKCETIGDRPYLVADLQLMCDTPRYFVFSTWAGFSAALYLAGIPYLFLVLVYRQRTRNVESYLAKLFHASELAAEEASQTARSWWQRALQRMLAALSAVAMWLSTALGAVTDRCLLEEARVPDLLSLFATQEAAVRAVQEEKDHLLQAALADCSIRRLALSATAVGTVRKVVGHRGPCVTTMRQIRGFLHRENLGSYHSQAILGFLFAAYTPTFWWFELAYVIRKLFLNGLVIFFITAEAQLIVSLLFCFLFVCLQLAINPYQTPSDNITQSMIAMQLFLTMFAGILTLRVWNAGDAYGVVTAEDKAITNAIGWFIILSSLVVAVLTCYLIATDSWKSAAIAKVRQEKRQRKLQTVKRKVLDRVLMSTRARINELPVMPSVKQTSPFASVALQMPGVAAVSALAARAERSDEPNDIGAAASHSLRSNSVQPAPGPSRKRVFMSNLDVTT